MSNKQAPPAEEIALAYVGDYYIGKGNHPERGEYAIYQFTGTNMIQISNCHSLQCAIDEYTALLIGN